MSDTLFSEDLASIKTDMPLLAAALSEEFTVKGAVRQTDEKGDRANVTLNSTDTLLSIDKEPLPPSTPHFATIWFSGDDKGRVKRELAKWVQALGLTPVPKSEDELIAAVEGKTGRFKVTIKNGFNRFEPVVPNGK